MLWGKAANRCASSDCRRELVMDETETDDPSIIGEECHIIAREDDGPRGDINFPKEQRDLYGNLILLCNVHHKIVDDQENFYTVESLKEMKNSHEEWVRQSLSIDRQKLKDDLVYSTYIDELVQKIDLENWRSWTSGLISLGQPKIEKQKLKELEDVKTWLFSRVMPNTYVELENAFNNFMLVLQDLINIFYKHAIEVKGYYKTEKIYKIDRWDPELYNKLYKEYMFHVDLVMDLTVELTRAANYLCDQVRRYLISDFRLKEGLILITSGPYIDLAFKTHRVNYIGDQRNGIPYKGLDWFKKERRNRDLYFGLGENIEKSEKSGITY